MSRHLLTFALMTVVSGSLMASQAVDDELAKFHEAADKAERTYQDGVAKERTRTINNLSAAAKRAAKSEPETADALYKLVLELDDMNADARSHFSTNGKLNAVLAEVAKRPGPLIGSGQVTVAKKAEPKIDMSGAKAIRITASYNSGYTLGSFKAGTVLIFQYAGGAWSGNNEAGDAAKNQNPDEEKSDTGNRVQLFIDSGNEVVTLTTLPTGTAAKPFVYTLDRDVVGLSLRIANRAGLRRINGGNNNNGPNFVSSYTGDVKYLVRIVR
jgi:hypothetical protein